MIKELNEQIQRLRDVLVTCYNVIKRKGGTIPEEGLRNMSNLPAAVLSIPQTHGVLTELTVTPNGEYLPEEGVDGFSKVTARFDTSSLLKVKASSLTVTNECINEYGRWPGELIDTKHMTSLATFFMRCTSLQFVNVSNWDVSNVTNMNNTFYGCSLLKDLDVSNWDVSNVTNMNGTFFNCNELQLLDTRNWEVSKCTRFNDTFTCSKLSSLVGGLTDTAVVNGDVKCLNGLCVSIGLYNQLDRASLLALVNGLADLTGQTAQTLTLGSTISTRLDTEQIFGLPAKEYLVSKAAEKNWTISF